MDKALYNGCGIPDHISRQVDHLTFEECEGRDLQGFYVLAADKTLDICTMFGFYTDEPSNKYLLIVTGEPDETISIKAARVIDA